MMREPQGQQEPPRQKVLVVDDSPEILAMLTDALTLEGMHVAVAASGRAALSAADECLPDIVLLDAMMPGIDGFETCRILKTEKGCEEVPIIFMTGFDARDHVVRALASGGVDFVTKPVVLDQLFARMRVHLANARRARSARKALDLTGRKFLACDRGGAILWTTPQAGELLRLLGLRHDNEAKLPFDIVDNLLTNPPAGEGKSPSYTLTKGTRSVAFRLFDDSNPHEILIRLVDRERGSYEEQLASAFALTARESEVLLWITYGKSNKEIADILAMSPRTVNKHLEQIFIKMAVENRTAAATMSVRILWND